MKTSELSKGTLPPTDVIKVLIADDDPPTRILLRAAISQWGYEVVEASNGEEAWEMLQQPNPPRLLILDWLMPKLDGISLCERIKHEQLIHPYTILLTQVTGTTNIIKGLEAGADEFLSKPFNMAELRSRLSVGARIIRFENVLAEQNTKVENYASQVEGLAKLRAKKLIYNADLIGLLGMLIENITEEICKSLNESQNAKTIAELRTRLSKVLALLKRLQVRTVYTPKTSNCQLNSFLHEVLNLCKTATQAIKLDLVLAEPLPPLSTDSDQLEELFLGLILSAIGAVKKQEQAFLRIETQATQKNTVLVTIEDNGPPLSSTELASQGLEQVHSRPFISVAREIIQRGGGTLEVENLAGKGLRLVIQLPLEIKNTERNA